MKSDAATVEGYIASLPEDRRAALTQLHTLLKANMPEGYVEAISWGMICYEVPLAVEPKTYNGKPLMYVALANQKNHIGIYLCGLYAAKGQDELFRKAWKGKRLDMGKSCIRAKTIEDLDLDLIGKSIAAMPVAEFVKASKR